MSTKDNLKKAMKIVKNHWVKGTYDNGSGRRCAVGAIRHVAGGGWASPESLALSKCLPVGYYSIVGFNDSKKTTHKDIMKLFRDAIRSL